MPRRRWLCATDPLRLRSGSNWLFLCNNSFPHRPGALPSRPLGVRRLSSVLWDIIHRLTSVAGGFVVSLLSVLTWVPSGCDVGSCPAANDRLAIWKEQLETGEWIMNYATRELWIWRCSLTAHVWQYWTPVYIFSCAVLFLMKLKHANSGAIVKHSDEHLVIFYR